MANRKETFPNIYHWLKPFNPLIAYHAIFMASAGQGIFEIMKSAQVCRFDDYYSSSVKEKWLPYCESQPQMMSDFGEVFAENMQLEHYPQNAIPETEHLVENYELYQQYKYGEAKADFFTAIKGMNREEFINYFNEQGEISAKRYEEKIEELLRFTRSSNIREHREPEKLIANPVISFFIKVFTPVLTATGLPYQLLHYWARQNNATAMELVLRYNPMVLQDRIINNHYHNCRRKNPALFNRYQYYQKELTSKDLFSPLKAKVALAVQIYNTGNAIYQRIIALKNSMLERGIMIKPRRKILITVKDIYKLYHALTSYLSKGEQKIDNDVGEDNTFKKSFDRLVTEQKQWQNEFGLNKTIINHQKLSA